MTRSRQRVVRQRNVPPSELGAASLAAVILWDVSWFLSRVLDTLAEMHFALGNNEHAARLFGAAAAARETVGASVFGFYRDEYERLISAARDRLGEDSFKKLWTEGRVLTLIKQSTMRWLYNEFWVGFRITVDVTQIDGAEGGSRNAWASRLSAAFMLPHPTWLANVMPL